MNLTQANSATERNAIGTIRSVGLALAWPVVLCFIGMTLWGSASRPARAQSWDYSPYRLRVWLAMEQTPELPETLVAELQRTLVERGDLHGRAAWWLDVQTAPAVLQHDIVNRLESVTVEDVMAADEKILENDKLYLLSIKWDLDRYRIQCRELDCRARMWGRIRDREVAQPPRLQDAAFNALADTFTPITRIEGAESKWATLRLRAAGLILSDDSPAAINVDDIVVPVVRRNNRLGEPLDKGIQVIPWTYLVVRERKGNLLTCRVHSRSARAVSGRSSARTQRFGFLARPEGESTTLIVTSRTDPPETLAGYDAYSKYPTKDPLPVPEPPETPDSESADAGDAPAAEAGGDNASGENGSGDAAPAAADGAGDGAANGSDPAAKPTPPPPPPKPEIKIPPELLGRSDWRGYVEIPKGDGPMRLVYLKNGGRLLARLPIVPGLEPTLTVDIANDDLRLEAEAFMAGVISQITDLVARRAVLSSQIRKKLKENKVAEAQEMFDELAALPNRNDFSSLLERSKQRFATDDRLSQRKIDRLFSDTREVLDKFVDDTTVETVRQEVPPRAAPPSGG